MYTEEWDKQTRTHTHEVFAAQIYAKIWDMYMALYVKNNRTYVDHKHFFQHPMQMLEMIAVDAQLLGNI